MKKPRKAPEKKKPLAVKPAATGPAAGAAVPPDDFQRRLTARRAGTASGSGKVSLSLDGMAPGLYIATVSGSGRPQRTLA